MNQAQIRTTVLISAVLLVLLIGFLPNTFFLIILKLLMLATGTGALFYYYPEFFPLPDSMTPTKILDTAQSEQQGSLSIEETLPAISNEEQVADAEQDVEQHFEGFLNTLFPLIRQTVVADTAVLMMVNYSKKTFFLRYFDTAIEGIIQPASSFDVNLGLPAMLLKHRKPILENQLPPNEALLPYYSDNNSTARAFMGVPITFQDAVIGLLCVDSQVEKAFSDEDLQLLENFSSLLAIHLDCSNRLYDYEDERRQRDAFDVFRDALRNAKHPAEFWGQCSDFLSATIKADRIMVAERTGSNSVMLLHSSGMEPPLALRTVFSDREGILGWVIRNQQPIVVNDFLKKENYVPRCGKNEKSEGVLASLVAVPVKKNGQIITVLSAESRSASSLGGDARQLLEKIATEAQAFLERSATPGTASQRQTPEKTLFQSDHLRQSLEAAIKEDKTFTLQLIGLNASQLRNMAPSEQEQFGIELSQWLNEQVHDLATVYRTALGRWSVVWPEKSITACFMDIQKTLFALNEKNDWVTGKQFKPEVFIGLTQYPEGGKAIGPLLGGAEKALLKAQLGEAGTIEIAIPDELLQNGISESDSDMK